MSRLYVEGRERAEEAAALVMHWFVQSLQGETGGWSQTALGREVDEMISALDAADQLGLYVAELGDTYFRKELIRYMKESRHFDAAHRQWAVKGVRVLLEGWESEVLEVVIRGRQAAILLAMDIERTLRTAIYHELSEGLSYKDVWLRTLD